MPTQTAETETRQGTPTSQRGMEGGAGGTGLALEEDREMPVQCLHSHPHTNRTLDSLNNVIRSPPPPLGEHFLSVCFVPDQSSLPAHHGPRRNAHRWRPHSLWRSLRLCCPRDGDPGPRGVRALPATHPRRLRSWVAGGPPPPRPFGRHFRVIGRPFPNGWSTSLVNPSASPDQWPGAKLTIPRGRPSAAHPGRCAPCASCT